MKNKWISLFCLAVAGCAGTPAQPTARTKPNPIPQAKAAKSKPAAPMAMTRLERGVFFRSHVLASGAKQTRLWIYAPTADPSKARGLVLVPPAGSDGVTGMRLTKDDRAEHLPYVRAGYAVVSFDIDGFSPPKATPTQRLEALRAFHDAQAGVANARAATNYMLATYPSLRRQIVTSGHSSGGTLALLTAAYDPRVNAVIAFAAPTDIRAFASKADLLAIEKLLPKYKVFLQDSSPLVLRKGLAQIPMFLFHTADDRMVSPEHTKRMMAPGRALHPVTRRVLIPSGGHYKAMLNPGMPTAMKWLANLPKSDIPSYTVDLPGKWKDDMTVPDLARRVVPLAKDHTPSGRSTRILRLRMAPADLSAGATRTAWADSYEKLLTADPGSKRMSRRVYVRGNQTILDLTFRSRNKGVLQVTMMRVMRLPNWNFTIMVLTPAQEFATHEKPNQQIIDSFKLNTTR